MIPGPVNIRLIMMARYNKSNSYPSLNPFDNFTTKIAPIMSIAKRIAEIRVKTPRIKARPPITSNNPIMIANSGGNPTLLKKF